MKPLAVTHLVRAFIFTAVALILFALPRLTQAQSPTVIYVNRNATGTPNGLTWTTAYRNLQDALAVATSGQEIWVARGVYYPDLGRGQTNNNVNSTFSLKNGVALYGGFAATETLRSQRNFTANVTILSGDIDGNDTNTDRNFIAENTSYLVGSNAYHVISSQSLTPQTIVDGFTVTAGNTDPYGRGGGMFNEGSSPTVNNVIFSGNLAGYYGGGMYNVSNNPIINNVTFSGNSAQDGGGMYNYYGSSPTMNNVTFSRNSAMDGGGMHNLASGNPKMNNVIFSYNSASGYGGGIYNYNSTPILSNVIISNNSAYNGGGIYNQYGYPKINNVIFWGNSAYNGGGVYNFLNSNSVMNNVIFSGNLAQNGGGIYNFYQSILKLTNVIMWDNKGSGSTTSPQASIFDPFRDSTTVISYSLIANWLAYGEGSLDGTNPANNPLFIDPVNGDFRLQSNSPVINVGLNSAVIGSTDLAGNPRIVGGIVDLGAYEYAPNTPPILAPIGQKTIIVTTPLNFTAIATDTDIPLQTLTYSLLGAPNGAIINPSTGAFSWTPSLVGTYPFTVMVSDNGFPVLTHSQQIMISVTPHYNCFATLNDIAIYTSVDAQAVRDAVGAANPGDTVKVAGYCAGVVKQGNLTQTVYITKALTLRGGYTVTDWTASNPISNPTTLDAQGAGRVVVVNTALNTPVQLENLILTHGLLTTTNQSGAGVYVTNATLVVSGSRVYSNSATNRGGGLYSNVGLTVINSQFEQNRVGNDGGALYGAGTVMVVNSIFSDNLAQDNGGAVRSAGVLTVRNSSFSNNSGVQGGAVYGNSTTTITQSTFTHNSASQNGGAVRAADKLSLTGTTFLSNTAFYGAGFYSTAEATVITSQFTGNVAQNLGGGIYGNISNTLTISNSQFNGNAAQYGGGVYAGNSLEVTASTFTDNLAQVNGGGIRAAGVVSVTQTTFTYNIAQAQGGGLYSSQKTTVVRSMFSYNTAQHGAGIAISSGQPVVIVNSLFTYNNAVTAGGGIYVAGSGNETQIIHSTFVYNVEHAIYVNGGTTWITNNIIALNNVGIQRGAGTVTQNYNLFYSNGEIAVGAVNGAVGMIIRNPLFVNPAAVDYRLQEGSLAIDSGLDMGVTTDYFNNARPNGAGVDRGYHEFDGIVSAASIERHTVYLPLMVR